MADEVHVSACDSYAIMRLHVGIPRVGGWDDESHLAQISTLITAWDTFLHFPPGLFHLPEKQAPGGRVYAMTATGEVEKRIWIGTAVSGDSL